MFVSIIQEPDVHSSEKNLPKELPARSERRNHGAIIISKNSRGWARGRPPNGYSSTEDTRTPQSGESGDRASTPLRALLATEPITYDSLPHLQSPPSSLCLALQDPHTPRGRQEAVSSCSPHPAAAAGVSYPENAWSRGAVERRHSVNEKKL